MGGLSSWVFFFGLFVVFVAWLRLVSDDSGRLGFRSYLLGKEEEEGGTVYRTIRRRLSCRTLYVPSRTGCKVQMVGFL